MDHRKGIPSRFVEAVRALDEEFYLRREVSEMLDVSASTMKVWGQEHPELAPHGYAVIENRTVYLYTVADIAALRAYQFEKYPIRSNGLRTRRRGGVKLWSAEETAERARRQRRIVYLKQRAKLAAERGEENRQLELLAEAEVIKRQLAEERRQRYKEATRPRRQEDWLLASCV